MLQRNLVNRLFGGMILQALVSTVALIALAAAVIRLAHGDTAGLVRVLVIGLVAAAVAAIGATGSARADDDGVHWRYYGSHSIAWSDMDGVTLRFIAVGLNGWRQPLVIRARGHQRGRIVTPVSGSSRGGKAFGRAVLAQAEARGIAVRDEWVGQNR